MADDPHAALRALHDFARDYRERTDALEAELRELRAERDRAILDAFAAGLTTREIAPVVGLSHQRVAQIVLQR